MVISGERTPLESRPRVAMLIPDLGMGGAEMVVSHLARGIDRSRYDLRLLVLANARVEVPIPEDLEIDRIPARRFATGLIGLTRWLNRVRPDVLIAHMSLPGVFAIIACRVASRRTAVVVVEHNMPSVEYAHETPRRRLIPFLMRRTYHRADALVSISESAAEDLEQLLALPSGAVQVIENPTLPDGFESRAAEAPGHPWLVNPDLEVLVAVGRLVPQKDYELLIRSFALVAPERSNLRLVIFGEGPLRSDIERLVTDLQLVGRVDLPGVTQNPYSAMRSSAALVMSSAYEGAPLVAIEAVACGARVVATDVGFLPDFLDAAAGDVVVEGHTPEAFADGIREVLRTPVVRQADAGGRIAPYRVRAAVGAYERLVEKLLAARSHPRSR